MIKYIFAYAFIQCIIIFNNCGNIEYINKEWHNFNGFWMKKKFLSCIIKIILCWERKWYLIKLKVETAEL